MSDGLREALASFSRAIAGLGKAIRRMGEVLGRALAPWRQLVMRLRVLERPVQRAHRQRVQSLMRTYRRRAARRARREQRRVVLRSAHA